MKMLKSPRGDLDVMPRLSMCQPLPGFLSFSCLALWSLSQWEEALGKCQAVMGRLVWVAMGPGLQVTQVNRHFFFLTVIANITLWVSMERDPSGEAGWRAARSGSEATTTRSEGLGLPSMVSHQAGD